MVEKNFYVTQTLPIMAGNGGQDQGIEVNVQLKPAPITVVVRPVIGASKQLLNDVHVALVCSNSKTGKKSRQESEFKRDSGDPYMLKSAAPLNENLDCELEVKGMTDHGHGLFTHTEPISAALGDEWVPLTVQVHQIILNPYLILNPELLDKYLISLSHNLA